MGPSGSSTCGSSVISSSLLLSCRYDYVEVYNGGDERAPMLGKFCGKIAPSPIISSGGQLLIKFVSDYETHGAGFSVRYEVFKTGGCLWEGLRCELTSAGSAFRFFTRLIETEAVFKDSSEVFQEIQGRPSWPPVRGAASSSTPEFPGGAEGRKLAPVSHICLPSLSGVHQRSCPAASSSSPAASSLPTDGDESDKTGVSTATISFYTQSQLPGRTPPPPRSGRLHQQQLRF